MNISETHEGLLEEKTNENRVDKHFILDQNKRNYIKKKKKNNNERKMMY